MNFPWRFVLSVWAHAARVMTVCLIRTSLPPFQMFKYTTHLRTGIYAYGLILIYSLHTTQSHLTCILTHMRHIWSTFSMFCPLTVVASHTHTCIVNSPRILSNKTETTDHVETVQFNESVLREKSVGKHQDCIRRVEEHRFRKCLLSVKERNSWVISSAIQFIKQSR